LAEYEALNAVDGMVAYVNQFIAPFVIKGRLGEGGIGQIFIAEDQSSKATQAVKVLKEDKSDPTLLNRFRMEFEVLNSLHHPCIVKVYKFHSGEVSFFTMEHIMGKTLSDAFEIQKREKRIEPSQIYQLIEVTFQCLEALHFLHSSHVIHRDLKPANIMIQENGRIKLLDFGVARQQNTDMELTQKQEIIGTFEYMAPEILAGEVYDHRIDLYSLGVILYRIITGTRMFEVYSFLDMFKAKSRNESPLLSKEGIPNFEWFVDLVNRLTMRLPGNRFKTAAAAIKWMEHYHSTSYLLEKIHTPLAELTSPILSIRSAPMLSRDRTLVELKKWVQGSLGHNLLVHGNSGTGKSRLLSFLHSEARRSGIPVINLEGQALSEDKSFFTQVFDLLHQTYFPEVHNPVYNQESDWTWSSGIFTSFLKQCDRSDHFIVITDDFHLLSKDIQKEIGSFFQMGTKDEEDIQISWVFVYSNEMVSRLLLEEGISLLELIPDTMDIDLSPLNPEETKTLAQYLLSDMPIDDVLAHEVFSYSNGLPFSTAHFLSILIKEKWLVRIDNVWSLSESAFQENKELGKNVTIGTGLIQNQIDLLDDAALDLIRILAILGEKVRFEIVENIYKKTDKDIEKIVSSLVILQLVNFEGPLIFFSDHKIRKKIYSNLTDEEKKEYHSRAMMLLEKYYGYEHPRHFLEFLYHANLAEDQQKINQYSAGIGVFFFNRGMYEEGQQYFGNALAHSPEKSTFLLVEFYFWKAECELNLARLREAHSDFLNAMKHLELIETNRTKKQHVQKDRIQIVITHKLLLIELQRHRLREVEDLRKQIASIHKRLSTHIRQLPISENFALLLRDWADFDFPLRPPQAGNFRLLKALYGSLIEIDTNGVFVPNLCSGWSWKDKERRLIFTLKKNIHYSNGALLRADDVIFSIKVIKEQEFYHLDLSPPSNRIRDYKVNADGEIEITYYPGPPPNMLFWCRLSIIPSYIYNHSIPHGKLDPLKSFIGSGPFQVSQVSSKGWGLTRSPKSKAKLKNINMFYDFPEALGQLKSGGFQLAQLHYRDWKKLVPSVQVNYALIRDQFVLNHSYRLCFKSKGERSLPKSVQKALYQSLPLENWNTLYLDNKYVVPRFCLLRTQSGEGQSKTRNLRGKNIEKEMLEWGARKGPDNMWQKKGENVVIHLLLPRNTRLKKIMRAIVKIWKSQGLDIHVAWRDLETFDRWIPHEKVDAWVDVLRLDPSLEGLADYLHSGSIVHGANYTGYKSEKMDHLVTAIQNTSSHHRKNLILKVHELFRKEMPWYPLFQPKFFYAFSTQLGGVFPGSRDLLHSSRQFEDLFSFTR